MLFADKQLFRFFHNDISTWDVALRVLPIEMLIAVVIWMLVERRSRSAWQLSISHFTKVDDGSAYRSSTLPAFHSCAPWPLRLLSLYGITLGLFGLLWPLLFFTDLAGGFSAIISLILEAVGMLAAILIFISAIVRLRTPDDISTFGRREAVCLVLIAVLFGGVGAIYLAGTFDSLQVDVHGIKYRDTQTLAQFTSSGFGLFVGVHTGVTWRLLLRTISLYGVLSAPYFILWARSIFVRVRQLKQSQSDAPAADSDTPHPSALPHAQ